MPRSRARPEIEAVLWEAEHKEPPWRVTEGRYYKLWCPRPCKHWKTVHRTPSGPNYVRNLRNFLSRYTCWDTEGNDEGQGSKEGGGSP